MKCYKCGKEIKDTDVDGQCPECFEQDNPLFELPEEVSKDVCQNCLSYKREGKWIDPDTTEIVETTFEVSEEALIEAINLNDGIEEWYIVNNLPEFVDAGELYVNYSVTRDHSDRLPGDVTLEVKAVGKLVQDVLQIKDSNLRVRTVPGQCKRCSKMAGGYFESIVQVRAENREIFSDERDKIVEIAKKKIDSILDQDRMGFLSKFDNMDEGVDFYMGSKSAARKLAEELRVKLGGDISESYTTVGWNNQESKEVSRNTTLLKIPEFKNGDFVRVRDDGDINHFRVESISKDRSRLTDLMDGSEFRADNEDVNLVSREENLEEGLVVSKGNATLQVMRMDSYETIDLSDPGIEVDEGDHIDIIELDRKYFAVPDLS